MQKCAYTLFNMDFSLKVRKFASELCVKESKNKKMDAHSLKQLLELLFYEMRKPKISHLFVFFSNINSCKSSQTGVS